MTAPTTTAAAGVHTTPGRPARVLGLDGKSYPDRALSDADQRFLIGQVHALRHIDCLSIRQIITWLDDELCIRRSVGWVSGILTGWRCDHCPRAVQGFKNGTPEHPVGPQAVAR